MRLMIVGDTHGDASFMNAVFERAKGLQIDKIIQVGDFGYWPHMKAKEDGSYFHERVARMTKKYDIPLYWIDGNHENHTELRAHGWPEVDGFWHMGDFLFYIPRGHKWEWMGSTFMGVGGAVSIDKQYRLQKTRAALQEHERKNAYRKAAGRSERFLDPASVALWWPEEQLSEEELEFVRSQGQADVLFTHDCPSNAPFNHRLKPDIDSQIHRFRINEVGHAVKPKLWFHGHMHDAYHYGFRHDEGEAEVFGLECNSSAMQHGPTQQIKVLEVDSTGVRVVY